MSSKGQTTGMLGVYLVAAELSRRGFTVSPASRSARGADLLVTDEECRKNIRGDERPEYAVAPSGHVAGNVKAESHHGISLVCILSRRPSGVRRRMGGVWSEKQVLCNDLTALTSRTNVRGRPDVSRRYRRA